MRHDAHQETDMTMRSHIGFEAGPPSLKEEVKSLNVELRAVSIGLQNKIEETEKLREQMIQIIDCLPIGAILFSQDRKILQINRAAIRLLDSKDVLQKGRSLDSQWQELHIPPPPFSHYLYKEKRLNCWEEVIQESGLFPCLTIRLLSEDQVDGSHLQDVKNLFRTDVNEVIAKISHDLRNALASIELFASLLVRRPCNESEHQRFGDQLQRSVRSLDQFMTNVMTSSVSKEILREKINLQSLFNQVEDMLAHTMESRHVMIRRIVAPDAEYMDGDWTLLLRACLNVVDNAISVTTPGGVVTVKTRRITKMQPSSSQEGDTVCIQVHDDGCGMKEDDLSHVCEPLYSKRLGGTGLGLSIVKDVMDAHQGTIDLQSQEGQGTTVSLSFPQQRRSA